MIKFSKILLLGLLNCFYLYSQAYIDPKLTKAIRGSNPSMVLDLLNKNKLTKEQKADLLSLADEVLKGREAKFARVSTRLNKILKNSRYLKLFLAGVTCAGGTLLALTYYFEAVNQHHENNRNINSSFNQYQKEVLSLCGATISGNVSGFSGLYGINLLYKIFTSKGKNIKRLDAFEVKSILSRNYANE